MSHLLSSLPPSLIDASRNAESSPNHNDEDLEAAVEWLNTQSTDPVWKQQLYNFIVRMEATPEKLAECPPEAASKLLGGRPDLVEEMMVADGPTNGNWVRALEIYEEIESSSPYVKRGSRFPVLQRLAVAIALVHATPVKQVNKAELGPDEREPYEYVHPFQRYLNYERAYIKGELDPVFKNLSIWDLTMVVDGNEPDEIAVWGRMALKNFRPDHCTGKKNWSYCALVKSDIPYGSQRVGADDPKLNFYQNILCNGGICGRRAFFGRFILRSFGIPTTARPSRGHAALCHYTEPGEDWAVNLGAGWGKGWTSTRYHKDVDFLNSVRARFRNPSEYLKVKLAQLLGKASNETELYGIHDEKLKASRRPVPLDLRSKAVVGLWHRVSLKVQESILNGPPNPDPLVEDDGIRSVIEEMIQEPQTLGSAFHAFDRSGKPLIRVEFGSFKNTKRANDVNSMQGFRTRHDGGNIQLYLPPFDPQGLTVLRGGSYKTKPSDEDANTGGWSGRRLLSAQKGKYNDWGFRVAMTSEEEYSHKEPEQEIKVGMNDKVSIEFVYIPPGEFVMGGSRATTTNENGDHDAFACVEVPHHTVRINKGFYMGKYPVTQEQYSLIKGNPSFHKDDPKNPVDSIGVDESRYFCEKVSANTGFDIRLPTEAEWEYAARGQTNGTSASDPPYFFGDDPSILEQYAWCESNSFDKTHPVGSKLANPFGLYDMYGNVHERVADIYEADYYDECAAQGVVDDPIGPCQGSASHIRCVVEDVPVTGNYKLVALVCTVTTEQTMVVSLEKEEKGEEKFVMRLPYTVGEWGESEPVIIPLKKGKDVLHFWRDKPPQYGVAVKEFTLTLVDETCEVTSN